MTSKIAFICFLTHILVLLIIINAVLAQEFPMTFNYQFPDVDPVKIYAGAVTFAHETHITDYQISCVRCHHDIDPDDTQKLAATMSRLLSDDPDCERIGQAGGKAVREKASLDRAAEGFVSAIMYALERRDGD